LENVTIEWSLIALAYIQDGPNSTGRWRVFEKRKAESARFFMKLRARSASR
jgi:hypothetical protein